MAKRTSVPKTRKIGHRDDAASYAGVGDGAKIETAVERQAPASTEQRVAALEEGQKMILQGLGDITRMLHSGGKQPPGDAPTAPQADGKLPPEAWRAEDEAQWRAFGGPRPPTQQVGVTAIETAVKPRLLSYLDYVAAVEGARRGEAWSRGDAVAYLISRAWVVDVEYRARGASGLKDQFEATKGIWKR